MGMPRLGQTGASTQVGLPAMQVGLGQALGHPYGKRGLPKGPGAKMGPQALRTAMLKGMKG